MIFKARDYHIRDTPRFPQNQEIAEGAPPPPPARKDSGRDVTRKRKPPIPPSDENPGRR